MPTLPLHPDESMSAASNISPDIVRNEEWVLRELYFPLDVSRQGEVRVSALAIGSIREGLSVHRMRYATAQFVQAAIDRRVTDKGGSWESFGVAKLKVADIRAIRWNNESAFIVKDTPPTLPSGQPAGHPGHASIHFTDPKKSDGIARKIRTKLLRYARECRMSVKKAYLT